MDMREKVATMLWNWVYKKRFFPGPASFDVEHPSVKREFLGEADAILALFEEERRAMVKLVDEHEEREASVCPEDVGCDEYIPVLERKLEAAEARCAEYEKREREFLGARDYEHEACIARCAKLVEALGQCRELFSSIRSDWTDPRSECREGWRIIDAALAAVKEDTSTPGVATHRCPICEAYRAVVKEGPR